MASGRRDHRFGAGRLFRVGEALLGCVIIRTRPYTTKKNTLYIATDEVVIDGTRIDLAGSGTLARGRRLSARDALKSIWTVPDWLNPTKGGCGMTYHPFPRWSEDGTLRSAARGQEFVAQPKGDAAWAWLASVLTDEQL